jgi:hypothetical protein
VKTNIRLFQISKMAESMQTGCTFALIKQTRNETLKSISQKLYKKNHSIEIIGSKGFFLIIKEGECLRDSNILNNTNIEKGI